MFGKYGVATEIAEDSRVFSKFPKKNTLFLIAGPPNPAPYCSRSKSGFFAAKLGRAAKSDPRPKANALPWKSFEPDFVMMFTPPVAVMPVDVSDVEVET